MNTYRHSLVLLAVIILPLVNSASAQVEETRNEQGAFGLSLSMTNGTLVITGRMAKDMPAFKAGLRPDDKILEVDGKSTDNLTMPEVLNLLQGRKVTLTILSSARERKKVTLKRATKTIEYYKQAELMDGDIIEAQWLAFKEGARAWRALSVKPELPEETQKQRILAENAVHEKRWDDAQTHYHDGLKACNFLWPNGLYNRAILFSEEPHYFLAASYMKAYVEMLPDAPDAKAMREKIIIWEDKWTRSQLTPSRDGSGEASRR